MRRNGVKGDYPVLEMIVLTKIETVSLRTELARSMAQYWLWYGERETYRGSSCPRRLEHLPVSGASTAICVCATEQNALLHSGLLRAGEACECVMSRCATEDFW